MTKKQESHTPNWFLEKAISIAVDAHEGQTDKAGQPYMLHVLTVMLMGRTIDEKICGVLHDVIEDTKISIDYLKHCGFPDHILGALQLLTHDKNDTYDQYIRKISKNPLATDVKLN